MIQPLRSLLAVTLVAALASAAAAQSAWLVQYQGEVGVTGPSGEIPVKVPLEVPQGSIIRT
ncbi:MAG: hypothetical protein KGL74_05795, partial [Elusimicrobia bacterium]|nr:hypothetical protein [Elusimicrobiota bacterium]